MEWKDLFDISTCDTSDIVSVVLLFFLFIYGIYSIYFKNSRRYNYPLWLDVLSLIIMFSILGLELVQLREWLRNYPLYYILAFVGLFIAVNALYSHNLVSVITHIALSVVHPGEESAPDIPRFGPAEMLEKKKDYEGALMEYMVLARIYPHSSAVHLRIANIYEKLNKLEEGMEWLKKSVKYLNKDNEWHSVVTRFCDFAEKLGKKQDAVQMIDIFLSKFPETEYGDSLRKRKKTLLNEESISSKSTGLVSLDAEPLGIENENTDVVNTKIGISIEKMESSVDPSSITSNLIEKENVNFNTKISLPNHNLRKEKNNTPPLEPL